VFDHHLRLFAHSDSLTCLQLCKPYSILVSAAQDGTCVVWDLNRLDLLQGSGFSPYTWWAPGEK